MLLDFRTRCGGAGGEVLPPIPDFAQFIVGGDNGIFAARILAGTQIVGWYHSTLKAADCVWTGTHWLAWDPWTGAPGVGRFLTSPTGAVWTPYTPSMTAGCRFVDRPNFVAHDIGFGVKTVFGLGLDGANRPVTLMGGSVPGAGFAVYGTTGGTPVTGAFRGGALTVAAVGQLLAHAYYDGTLYARMTPNDGWQALRAIPDSPYPYRGYGIRGTNILFGNLPHTARITRTGNGGAAWSDVSTFDPSGFAANRQGRCVASGWGGSGQMARSTDDGLTWQAVPGNSQATSDVHRSVVSAVDLGPLYATHFVALNGSNDRLMYSADGGDTWGLKLLPAPINQSFVAVMGNG